MSGGGDYFQRDFVFKMTEHWFTHKSRGCAANPTYLEYLYMPGLTNKICLETFQNKIGLAEPTCFEPKACGFSLPTAIL